MKTIQKKLNENEALEGLVNGISIDKMRLDDKLFEEYTAFQEILDLPIISDNPEFTYDWIMPKEYKELDIRKYLLDKCSNDEQKTRVEEELLLFEMANKLDLVRYLVYLTNYMTKNNIVWGVGRGSSVSVYILYLIGIHKVDSIKYNLDYTDFFKVK